MARTNSVPLHDRVVVKRIDAEEKFQGRHHHFPTPPRRSLAKARSLPSARAARDESGKVIKPDVKAGDRVLFGKWSGTEVKLDGGRTADHEGIRHHGRARLSRPRANQSIRNQ